DDWLRSKSCQDVPRRAAGLHRCAGRPRSAVGRLSSDPVTTPAGLVDLLIDDAAVFPPGLAPLDEAVPEHRRLRASALAGYLGPFLAPAGRWDELLPLLDDEAPLDLVLISRRGDPVDSLAAALHGLRGQ